MQRKNKGKFWKLCSVLMICMLLVLPMAGCSEELSDVNEDQKVSLEESEENEDKSEDDVADVSLEESDTKDETDTSDIDAEKTSTDEDEASGTEVSETVSYTYSVLSKILYASSTVNVRSLPTVEGERIGSLSKGQEVTVSGQCNETGWYRISYNGSVGYVSDSYLVADKPVEETYNSAASGTANAQASTSTQNTTATSQSTSTSASSSGASTPSVTVPTVTETQGNLVWVPTNGGTKYHSKSSCSQMKDPIQVTVETAIANGYTPCGRCY